MDHKQKPRDPLAGVRVTPRKDMFVEALTVSGLTYREVEARAHNLGTPVGKDIVRQMRAAADSDLPLTFKLRTAMAVAGVLQSTVADLFESPDWERFTHD